MKREEMNDLELSYLEKSVRVAAAAELAGGPMPLGKLARRLAAAGHLPHIDGSDIYELAAEVDELLLDTDEFWVEAMGKDAEAPIFHVPTALDGVVFTHKLSASELSSGRVSAFPDLVIVDFDLDFDECLELDRGGNVKVKFSSEAEGDGIEALHGAQLEMLGPEGWLDRFSPGDLVAFCRNGRTLSLRAVSEVEGAKDGIGDPAAEVKVLTRAVELHDCTESGVEPTHLIMTAFAYDRDRALFRRPLAPIGELLVKVGLEGRGDFFGKAGSDWEPPGVVRQRQLAEVRRLRWGFDQCCESAYELASDAYFSTIARACLRKTDEESDREEESATWAGSGALRDVAIALEHGSVASALAEEVLRDQDCGNSFFDSFASELASLGGRYGAPGLYLRALNAERDGRTLEAESFLAEALRRNPKFAPASSELAWYASDRGEASRAIALLRADDIDGNDSLIEFLSEFAELPSHNLAARVGRNDPCPCGSGIKAKRCCAGKSSIELMSPEQHSKWLFHKLIRFCGRPHRRKLANWLFTIAHEASSCRLSSSDSEHLAVLVDFAIHEGELVEEFLSKRGMLLPQVEVEMLRAWVQCRRRLWEVLETDPEKGLVALRDTRNWEEVTILDRAASREAKPGDCMMGLVAPAGDIHVIIGVPVKVELAQRDRLIALLDADPDAEDLAAWFGSLFAPPAMFNREGESIMMCTATLRPEATQWSELETLLDDAFGERETPVGTADAGKSVWTETHALDEAETVVRCFLRRNGDDLCVEANSIERFERVLGQLSEICPDLELIERKQTPLEQAAGEYHGKREETDEGPGGSDGADEPRLSAGNGAFLDINDLPAEAKEAIRETMMTFENRWLEESIPALGGLTPRQAVNDPTRREDLLRLLREYDDLSAGNLSGGIGLDPTRLRDLLGIA
ncbi:MAG: SEC-C metal-binding domain-containing protein [Acidimicrobiales bacterium]